MKVGFYDLGQLDDSLLKYAVIVSMYNNKWIFVRHKDRTTWELPGGRREAEENINETASRELHEETGALRFSTKAMFDYSVTFNNNTTYGRVYFSEIEELGDLPKMEIKEIILMDDIPKDLTYPDIQPCLYENVIISLLNRKGDGVWV